MSLPQAGPRWDGSGVHFEVVSRHATAVDLCLFDELSDPDATANLNLVADATGVWRLYVPGVGPGQLYGFRVTGPWQPEQGHWFNPRKLLLDPTALAIVGDPAANPTLAVAQGDRGTEIPDPVDTAALVPKSVVVDRSFDWNGIPKPGRSWSETLIYECHVKGLTQRHPEIPEPLRGTYLGMAHDAIIDHLLSLGVTAVELLPVQHHISEPRLHDIGLSNYFGYNPIGLFAPHAGYATDSLGGRQVIEFKTMVKALHRAGIEVLLDVVFNHTAEGDPRGPTLAFRGIGNRSYYRLLDRNRREYEDFSGCGNTLDFDSPRVCDLVLSCLRYWVDEMHIDGFRFDLAPVLGRGKKGFGPTSRFLGRLRQDRHLRDVKLIAEPWDLGPNGYQLGNFPPGWAEWNDRFRDGARRFWRGDRGESFEFGLRMLGSPDIFNPARRPTWSSINFVTSHDGFTLEDLVSYETKHNLANGENDRDGHNHNASRNWGVEGPTDSPEILSQRARTKRNLLASTLLGEGTPMISHGDEVGRTQHGNNNAYCHDSELTWVDWSLDSAAKELLDFTRRIVQLRHSIGVAANSASEVSLKLVSAHGETMNSADWRSGRQPLFGLMRQRGRSISVLIFNHDTRGHLFKLPSQDLPGTWTRLVDTSQPGRRRIRGQAIRVAAYSLVVVRFSPASV